MKTRNKSQGIPEGNETAAPEKNRYDQRLLNKEFKQETKQALSEIKAHIKLLINQYRKF